MPSYSELPSLSTLELAGVAALLHNSPYADEKYSIAIPHSLSPLSKGRAGVGDSESL